MKLVDDWKAVALKAWSMRWMYGATILGAFEVVLPLFQDKFPRGVFAVLSVTALLLGIVSRVIQQKNINGGGDGP
jgi:fluoride ion exporter CrcB/FEX